MTDSFFGVRSKRFETTSFTEAPFVIVDESLHLTIDSLSSPDYLEGLTGWSINKNGDAEFNNVVVRGSFAAGSITVGETPVDDFIVLPDGKFGAGNVKIDTVLGEQVIVPRVSGDEGYITDGAYLIWDGLSLTVTGDAVMGGASIVDGSITSAKIANGTIINEDINTTANIAQSKIFNLTSDLALKAPLASPSLTGTPTAPTATAGTNTTQLATTAFVKTEITNLIDAAPTTLDTLNELAAALGDDPNFATTISSELGLKAPLASPTFTGTVVLPSTTSIGNVSATELGYLDGVTSAIQTQIDTKAPSAGPTFTGTVTLPNSTISTLMIQDDAVDSTKLKDSATIDADRAVDTNHIKNLSVTNDKIASGTIAEAKLDTALQTKLADYESRIATLESYFATTGSPVITGVEGHTH